MEDVPDDHGGNDGGGNCGGGVLRILVLAQTNNSEGVPSLSALFAHQLLEDWRDCWGTWPGSPRQSRQELPLLYVYTARFMGGWITEGTRERQAFGAQDHSGFQACGLVQEANSR